MSSLVTTTTTTPPRGPGNDEHGHCNGNEENVKGDHDDEGVQKATLKVLASNFHKNFALNALFGMKYSYGEFHSIPNDPRSLQRIMDNCKMAGIKYDMKTLSDGTEVIVYDKNQSVIKEYFNKLALYPNRPTSGSNSSNSSNGARKKRKAKEQLPKVNKREAQLPLVLRVNRELQNRVTRLVQENKELRDKIFIIRHRQASI